MNRVSTPEYLSWLYDHMLQLKHDFPAWSFSIIQTPTNCARHPQIRAFYDDTYWHSRRIIATRLCKNRWNFTVLTLCYDEPGSSPTFELCEREQLDSNEIRKRFEQVAHDDF